MDLNKLISDICTPEHVNLQRKCLSILKQTIDLLDAHSIPYWLGYGTLVGCLRHGGFVPWDDDVDICISVDHITQIEEAIITTDNLELKRANDTLYRIHEACQSIDIFVLPEYDESVPHEMHNNEIYPLQRGMFNGIECSIPHDSTAFFLRRYGNTNPLDICLIWNHKVNDYWKADFDFNKFVIPFNELDEKWKLYNI